MLIVVSSTVSCQSKKEKKNVNPNVILFLVDDMGWTDAKAFGSDLYQTPNVDKLVSQGTSFDNAYAACTVCSPTRGSIMTGKYPARLHLTDWIAGHKKPYAKMNVPDWNKKLDLEEVTLAERFKSKGYSTIHLGKWHLGEEEKHWPENQGFDINLGGHSGGSPKANNGNGYFSPYNNPRLKDGEKGEYLTERLANEAVNYIKTHKDKPFFMNYWLYNVHLPLQAKKEKILKYKQLIDKNGKHKNAAYAAMVEHMDDALGKVLSALKENKLEDNTIVVFHSDNGGIIGNYWGGKITNNTPLKSGKGDIYEGGVRVPLVFKWPQKIKAGELNHTLAISPDIYTTILKLADKSTTFKNDIDGQDLSPLLLDNKEIDREAIYWHYPHYHPEGAKPYSAVRKGDWKLIQIFEEKTLQLYNLKEDIGETKNLVSEHPEKTKELLDNLNNWREKVHAQMPTTNPDYDKEQEGRFVFKKKKSK